MLTVILKGAREWYASLPDESLRAELAKLERMCSVGMADSSDLRVIEAELARR